MLTWSRAKDILRNYWVSDIVIIADDFLTSLRKTIAWYLLIGGDIVRWMCRYQLVQSNFDSEKIWFVSQCGSCVPRFSALLLIMSLFYWSSDWTYWSYPLNIRFYFAFRLIFQAIRPWPLYLELLSACWDSRRYSLLYSIGQRADSIPQGDRDMKVPFSMYSMQKGGLWRRCLVKS